MTGLPRAEQAVAAAGACEGARVTALERVQQVLAPSGTRGGVA